MVDNLTAEDRRKTMRAVKGRRTRLETRLFAMLAGMGLRGWKQNIAEMPGKPDVVFAERKIVIFVDGCFWHGCPVCKRKLPETNREYWERKIARNIELAQIYQRDYSEQGWRVIRIWEHQIRNPDARQIVRDTLRKALCSGDDAS